MVGAVRVNCSSEQFLQIESFRACSFLLMRVACWLAYGSVLAALFVRVLNISLCATVDIMSSSSSCFAILVLIDDPQGPPPESPRPVYIFSEQKN